MLHHRNLDFKCQINKQAGYFKLYVTKGYLQTISKIRVGRDLNTCTDNHQGTENLRTDFCRNLEIGFYCRPVIVAIISPIKLEVMNRDFFQNRPHDAKYMKSLF